MTPAQVHHLRPGTEIRLRDELLGSVRAVVDRQDRASRRTLARRFDLAAGDFESEAVAIEPADVLGLHRRFG